MDSEGGYGLCEKIIRAVTCDVQQYGILTSVYEPVQPSVKAA